MTTNIKTFRKVGSLTRQALGWSCGRLYAHLSGTVMAGVLLAVNASATYALEFAPLQHTDECPG